MKLRLEVEEVWLPMRRLMVLVARAEWNGNPMAQVAEGVDGQEWRNMDAAAKRAKRVEMLKVVETEAFDHMPDPAS